MRQINDTNQLTVVFKQLTCYVRQLDEYRCNAKSIENLFSQTLNEQRLKLRTYCEKMMFEMMTLKVGNGGGGSPESVKIIGAVKKIEELLWQKIFYETIASGKKLKGQLSAHELFLLRSHLYSASGYYHHLLMKLLSYYRYAVDDVNNAPNKRSGLYRYEETVVRDRQEPQLDCLFDGGGGGDDDAVELDGNVAAPIEKPLAPKILLRHLIYRALMCLGDLNRYKLTFANESQRLTTATNRKIAIGFYTKAANCCPEYGMPFNQIASVMTASAGETGASLDSVYFYLRSLNCRVQFNGSEGNLLALYEKKLQSEQSPSPNKPETSNAAEITRFLDQFQVWILGLFFERNEPKTTATIDEAANGAALKPGKKLMTVAATVTQPSLEELLKSFDKCLDFVGDATAATGLDHLNDDTVTKMIAIVEFVAVKLLLAKRTRIVLERVEQFLLAVWTKLVKRSLQNSSFDYCDRTSTNGSVTSATNTNSSSSSSTSKSSSPTAAQVQQPHKPTWLKSIKMLSDWFVSRSTLRDENSHGTEQFSLAKHTSSDFVGNLFRLFNAIRTQAVVSGVNIMDVETTAATDADDVDEKWIVAAVRALDDVDDEITQNSVDEYPVSEDFLLKNTLVFDRYRDRYGAIRWFYYERNGCGGNGDGHDPVSFSNRFDQHLRLLKLTMLGKLFAERVFQKTFRFDRDSKRFVSVRPEVKENVKTTSDKQLMESMGQLWIEAEIKELEHQIETSRYSSPILIVEANAFINHFSIVKYLVSTRRYVVIVPNAVLGVLDEQKLQSVRVREMIRWLEKMLCDGNRFIRAQRAHEKLALPLIRCPRQQRRGRNYRHYANAMGVAECCNYFVTQTDSGNLMVTLLYDYGVQNCCSTSAKNDLIALAKSVDVRSELITFFYESLRNIKQRKY